MKKLTRTRFIALFIALALSVTWFEVIRPTAFGNSNNSITPFVFTADSHQFSHHDKLLEVWKPRVGGIWIAGRLVDAVSVNGEMNKERYANAYASYHAAWLLLLFVALVCFADHPIFIIPMVFAGLIYTLTPPDDITTYPWDMPSVFFFTLSFLLWQRGNYVWMLTTIVLGTAFKETVAVTALLFFFTPLAWKKRLGFFGSAFVGCVLLKIWITSAVMGHAQLATATYNGGGSESFSFDTLNHNLGEFFSLHLNHFLWINAGTFVVALLLPVKTMEAKGIKTVLAVFFVGQSLAGAYREFREWMDVLPMSVIYLSSTVDQWMEKHERRDNSTGAKKTVRDGSGPVSLSPAAINQPETDKRF